MLKIIDNIYYRFYRILLSIGEKDTPRYNAVLVLSILGILNFVTVLMFMMGITKRLLIVDLPKIYMGLIGLIIIAINSYIVFRNKRYRDIEERYKNEDKTSRIRNNLKAMAYVIVTILLLIISLVYLYNNPIVKRN